ncbi:MAG TPA: endonuclease/exonuclease/phosphatase family protein [Pyrinomonadaceae bacterium]|jgi:endonuclease/exonuclease/phosphatase (EEP) superfamily protein YafD
MKWTAIIIGILGILFTFKPFIRSANWFIRIGDFPRVQILILLVVSLAFFAYVFDFGSYFDWTFTVLLSLCIFYQLQIIIPFTPLHRRQVQPAQKGADYESDISLLIFNVLMENDRYADALQMIERYDADIVLLAEPDENWAKNLAPLEKKYPYTVFCPLDNRYGMMLYSRLPLHDTELQFLIQDDIPSIHTQVKLPTGRDIALHGVHPRPPMPGENTRSTERDGELLLVGNAIRESDLPCIVAGDLNDVAWSRTTQLFKRISGLLDPRVGRGFYNTFHAHYPILRVPLDHVFHSPHFRLAHLERVADACGSDHFPVFIRLSLEPEATAIQANPEADREEHEEATEVIAVALKENRFKRLPFRRLREQIARLRERISRRRRK